MVLARGLASLPRSVRLPPTLVILSAAKDLALTLARPGSPVPCGCRRAGYFPLGESNQSRPRGGLRPAARGALRCSPGASRRELAHPWARTGAPCSRARLRCSALANAGKVNSNSNSNSASVRWPWFLIFIPLRQRRDCAGKARRVSVWDTLTRRRPWMAIGAPRAGTRTRAAGAAVGVGFLRFLSLPTQRKEPARRQPHGTGESCRDPRHSEILRCAQDDKSRRQPHGTEDLAKPRARTIVHARCRVHARAMSRPCQGGTTT